MQELSWTRFVVKERLEGFSAIVGKATPQRRKRPWKIESSIWAARARWCDSKGFWDTDGVICKMLECDWKRAVGVGLSNYIERNDRDEDDGDDVPETQARNPRLHAPPLLPASRPPLTSSRSPLTTS